MKIWIKYCILLSIVSLYLIILTTGAYHYCFQWDPVLHTSNPNYNLLSQVVSSGLTVLAIIIALFSERVKTYLNKTSISIKPVQLDYKISENQKNISIVFNLLLVNKNPSTPIEDLIIIISNPQDSNDQQILNYEVIFDELHILKFELYYYSKENDVTAEIAVSSPNEPMYFDIDKMDFFYFSCKSKNLNKSYYFQVKFKLKKEIILQLYTKFRNNELSKDEIKEKLTELFTLNKIKVSDVKSKELNVYYEMGLK